MRTHHAITRKLGSIRGAAIAGLLGAVALLGMNCPESPLLLAAACSRDITPISPGLAAAYEAEFGGTAVVNHSDPIFLAGFGDKRQATGYNDRLWARGVVMDGAGGSRNGSIQLHVPPNRSGLAAVDDGQTVDSTGGR